MSTEKSLYLELPSGQNYGWGVCGNYLKKELARIINTVELEIDTDIRQIPGKLFLALADVNFSSFIKARGIENYGYTFFENELTEKSFVNAGEYDLIFCGSEWCRNKLINNGIKNADILIQGIDPEIFYPLEEKKDDAKFIIFSGGKFEFRKGQDIVLKAVKILQEKYSDIHLITAWNNIWPETMHSMAYSRNINYQYVSNNWRKQMEHIYQINGLDSSRIKTYQIIPYKKQRDIYSRTDIGIFPNRCEGGTNLVMMEYMACAKPVIATYGSGQKDIVNHSNALLLEELKECKLYDQNKKLIADWDEPDVEELVDKIEFAYHNRNKLRQISEKAGEDLKKFSWKHSAVNLISRIFKD